MPREYIFNLRLQDSRVPELRMEEEHVPVVQNVDIIPEDLARPDFRVVVPAGADVRPRKIDRHGEMIYDFRFPENSAEFDCVQVFFVADFVVRGFKYFYKTATGKELSLIDQAGRPLCIFPHFKLKDGERNAEYDPGRHEIHFSFYRGRHGQIIQLCDTSDIVAHEIGHALLSVANVKLSASHALEPMALHEAFGDLCAGAFLIEAPGMLSKALAFTGGNLMNPCFLNTLAEQFGQDLRQPRGLRVLNDRDALRSTVKNECHDLSRVFSSAIYKIFVETYEARRINPTYKDFSPEQLVTQTYMEIAAIVLSAMLRAGANATFASVARDMSEHVIQAEIRERILREFTQREVFMPAPRAAAAAPVLYAVPETVFGGGGGGGRGYGRGAPAGAAASFHPQPYGIQHHGPIPAQDPLSRSMGRGK